jgi:quinol monooxygenase YgiN
VENADMSEPSARLLPDRLGLVVRLQARPGARPAVLDALHRYADRLDEEPQTELFVISLDPDEADVVWLHEWFASGEDGMLAHRRSPGFAELMGDLGAVLAVDPQMMRFDPLRVHLASALVTDDGV